jgi:hypothetical protein
MRLHLDHIARGGLLFLLGLGTACGGSGGADKDSAASSGGDDGSADGGAGDGGDSSGDDGGAGAGGDASGDDGGEPAGPECGDEPAIFHTVDETHTQVASTILGTASDFEEVTHGTYTFCAGHSYDV